MIADLIFFCFFFQLAIEKLEKELVLLDEKRKAVQAVQKLKHKQIALLLQSLADIEATVEEVRFCNQSGRCDGKLRFVLCRQTTLVVVSEF